MLLYIIFLTSLTNVITQFSYPMQKSSRYSFTVYKDKKVDGSTNMVEMRTDYIDYHACITACFNIGIICKSIEGEIQNNNKFTCRFFNDDSPKVKRTEGFLFISTKPPNCSQSCSLKLDSCGKCDCNPSCAGRNRRQHNCNCKTAAGIAKSCQEHYDNGFTKTGIFQISPKDLVFETLCEMEKFEHQNPQVIVLNENKKIATINNLQKEYSVYFKFKPISNEGFANVIHFTTGVDICFYGCRIPSVFIESTGELYISSAINDNYDYVVRTSKIPLNQWSSIQISQTQSSGSYIYTVYLNGQTITSVFNLKPQIFPNVNVYATDPWWNGAVGFIKDLKILNGNDIVQLHKDAWIPIMTRFSSWEPTFWDKTFKAYEDGFGLINQQWIGLKKLNQLTSTFFTDMRVEYFISKDIKLSTMYYNVIVGSSNDNYVLNYDRYDPKGLIEPDQLNANGKKFLECSIWWTDICDKTIFPTSTNYIFFGSYRQWVSIQFLLRTKKYRA
ncbi:uncharacterized protein LOC105847418 isoform X5 [Hydra vulgaris]|uniref:Uncharacterized protein LOC105847418 isoform X5 n=1 Tax=Hydra vulgaris TaxID=6087 RepID=A0ABM4BRU6_HYDVU